MRHGKKFNHLGRTASHRKAMLQNMAASLILHKRIETTVAKAKALQRYVEPLITRSKSDTTHSRRIAFSHLQNKVAVTELFREVGPKVADRPGGYTRIIKMGFRLGDSADMAMIELVDFNELYSTDKPEKKTRRSRRGGKKKETTAVAEEVETKVEDTVEAVEEKAEEVVEKTETAAETVEEKVDEATEKVEEKVEEVAEKAEEKAEEVVEDTKEEAPAEEDSAEEKDSE